MHDVIIIGGGPAGLSAAAWCGELGLKYCLIESSTTLGGQLGLIHLPIKNYPGIPSISSAAFLKNLVDKLDANSTIRLGAKIKKVSVDPISIEIEGSENLEAKALIIATGVRRRELGVPGEHEFVGKGILDSGSRDPSAVAGQTVVIVGGGDAAFENAVILSPHAAKVFVVHRGANFSARPQFLQTARSRKNVEFLTESVVESFIGDSELRTVQIQNLGDNMTTEISATRALVRIGVVPNSELFGNIVYTDRDGYIKIDSNCRTNVENIFAIGDVANPVSPTIATAAGTAATAAKAISFESRL